MARLRRSAALVTVMIVVAAALTACDPGYSYWVQNDTDQELTVSFEGQWFVVPAHGAGRGVSSLGVYEGSIEVADAACVTHSVVEATTQEGLVIVDETGARLEDRSGNSSDEFDALPQNGLEETDRCYGLVRPATSGAPADGPATQSLLLIGGPDKDISRIEADGSGLAVLAATPLWEQGLSADDTGASLVADTVGPDGPGPIVRSDDHGPLEPVVADGWGADISPDGSSIAFIRGTDAYEHGRLFVLGLDGVEQEIAPDAQAVRWSPDGTWLAYEVWVGATYGDNQLWVVRPDGTGARRLTATDEQGSHAIWAPDSWRLAWTRNPPGEASIPSILLYDLADPAATAARVLPGAPTGGWSADGWSPDGARLLIELYGAGDDGPAERVASVDLDSFAVAALSDPGEFRADGQASWSTDGQSILFLRDGEGEYYELWVMDAAGDAEHLVATGVAEAMWDPAEAP